MSGPGPVGAVLLDRDGTVITETGYLLDPDHMVLVPGAAAAIARINSAGLPVALVTNQSAVGRGWLEAAELDRIHAELARRLAEEGARLDLVLSAFEHPEHGVGVYRADSPRRKPGPGMLLEAAQAFGVSPESCWMVGDGARDLEAARRAGARGILVATGKGLAEWGAARQALGEPPLFVPDLTAAVDLILAEARRDLRDAGSLQPK